jgi:DNA polymerase-3 subunit delta
MLKVHPFVAKELVQNKKKHPAKMISRNFTILREYDMLAKGVGSAGVPDEQLMKELVYKLLH